MTINDILMFVLYGYIDGQRWENTYFYRVADDPSLMQEGEFPEILSDWLDWWLATVFAPHAQFFSSALSINGVRGENLFNVATIGAYESPAPTFGSGSGDSLPSFVAYSWTTPSLRRGMNAGQRRMPGVTESTAQQFGIITTQTQAALALMGVTMGQDRSVSWRGGMAEALLRPVIVKRVREGQGTVASPYEYTLPRTQAQGVSYRANGWTPRNRITTQNSRKYGRGI